jgi:hypothetical protein
MLNTFRSAALFPGPLRYVGWLFATVGLLAVIVGLAALFLPSLAPLSREGGVMEVLSLVFWGGAMVIAVWAAARQREAGDRLAAGWTGLIALLAFLREMDLHTALNPQVLGRFGVRYRIDWWLDQRVNLWLKLAWLAVFLALLLALAYPPWALRRRIFQLVRKGDPMVGLFVVAIAMSFGGFVFDDLLRKTTLLSMEIRQTAEETSEMLGAAAFLVSAFLQCPRRQWHRAQIGFTETA